MIISCFYMVWFPEKYALKSSSEARDSVFSQLKGHLFADQFNKDREFIIFIVIYNIYYILYFFSRKVKSPFPSRRKYVYLPE